MKPMHVLLLALLLPVAASAQGWVAFNQILDAQAWAGKRFRVEAMVKAEVSEPKAGASMWVRVDLDDKKIGFFQNGMQRPVRGNDWELRTITGTINKNAARLFIGGLCGGRGMFWFDGFRLFIEQSKGKFEEVPLKDPGFEGDSVHRAWNYYDAYQGYFAAPAAGGYQSARALRVDGLKAKRAIAFGSNDSLGRYFERGATKLYYEVYGSGAPLLLLHGNSESIAGFKEQIPELSKHYKVIAVDTRGQGQSTEDGTPYSYDLFAEDMNAFLDHLGLDSVRVLGWSDGGNTGLIMAMRYPKKVKALVTMGANVFIDKTVVDKWVYKAVADRIKEVKDDTGYAARNNVRLATMLVTEPKHSFEEIRAIKCPVLVVAGEKDVIREEHTRGIAEHIPNATLHIAPKQTHEFPREAPAIFNKLVLDFFKSIN